MARLLGNIAVGTVLKLNENGSPQNYIVVHQGLPSSMYSSSCNGTWLLRKYVYGLEYYDQYHWSLNGVAFPDGLVSIYETAIQNVIKSVKIPFHRVGSSYVNSGESGYPCKVFSLSEEEVGSTSNLDKVTVGAKLSYFISGDTTSAKSKRLAKSEFGYGNESWWLRDSGSTSGSDDRALYVAYDGVVSTTQMIDGLYTRPAIIMPTDLIVDDNNNITANTAPSPPSSITVPTDPVPAGSTISVSWTSVSGATSYTLQRSANGGSWQTIQTNSSTSYMDTANAAWTQVQYRVATVANGFTSAYVSSTIVTVLPYSVQTLTVPSQIMEGQSIPISWSAVNLATNYILQRNADSGGWEQIYSGASTSYTDTPGDWSNVQYRVQAGANNVYGAFTTSAVIPVISASVLVISGTDEDLGVLTEDVPYTVSTDIGNPITLTRKVNGILVATLTVQSGFAYTIPVMDLPTGTGTIEIQATVNATSGGPVSATRTWTYTKTPITFPNVGGVAQLSKDGQNVFPPTLAEAVRVPTNWGGTLDKALELLYDAANSAVISVGSYEGTGTYGADNPNTLTISPSPQVVTIYGGGQTLVISSTDTSSPAYIDGTTVKWYSTVSAAEQMNTSGVTYSYVAVAKGVSA